MAASPLLALVALSEPLLPSVEGVNAQFAERFPDAQPLEQNSRTEGGVTFQWPVGEIETATGNYTLVDRPIPWSQLEGPCATAWYWPEAEAAMRNHAGHLFVTLLDETNDPIGRMMNLTRLITAVAATTPSVGLVWGPSSQVHKPVDFAVLAAQMAADDLPLHLWVDFRVTQLDEPNAYALFTTGMESLGSRELEVPRFAGDPQTLAGAAYNIAHYLLEKKATVKQGEAIGLPDGAQAVIDLCPSMIDPRQEVIQLEFE